MDKGLMMGDSPLSDTTLETPARLSLPSFYKLHAESYTKPAHQTRQIQDIIIYKYKTSNFKVAYREITPSI
jgi:hypothetical protein